MRVRERGDGDRLRRGARRARRAEPVVVAVVPGRDDGDDACRDDVPHRLDERVAGRVGLRPAAREVDHVHAVLDGRLERGHDLGRVADVADRRRHVEDAVVADVRSRSDAGEARRRRVVAAARRRRAGVAGRDPRDVRAVEGGGPVERELAPLVCAGAHERPCDDHLRRRPLLAALGESRRIGEAGRVEEAVGRVDPVVDDRDLHPLAAAAARRGERARADQTRAAVERERVPVARIQLLREREPGGARELGRRQLDRQPVQQDGVAPSNGCFRDGALQGRGRRALRALQLGDVGPRRPARRAQPPGGAAPGERARVGRERRVGEREDDLDPAGAVTVGNGDRPGPDPRQLHLSVATLDRLEGGGRGRRGAERHDQCDGSGEAAHEPHSTRVCGLP